MTLTILSTQSEAIKKYVKERMRREAEELGFDPYVDTQQQAFEREVRELEQQSLDHPEICLLYTSPSPRDGLLSRMPSSA